jgi:hypothetical protein
VLNPEDGIIVSSNNFVTGKNVKYGLSYAFSFSHRAVRINELIKEFYERDGLLDSGSMM